MSVSNIKRNILTCHNNYLVVFFATKPCITQGEIGKTRGLQVCVWEGGGGGGERSVSINDMLAFEKSLGIGR